MTKFFRILLLPIFALTTIFTTYADSPDDNRDSVVVFKFIAKKETFWATFKDNEQQFDKLANFIHLHREKIMRGKMPIYVNGYCSTFPTPEDNKRIGRIRSNHVKSYIILNYGFREEMFKTKNHVTTYQELDDVVTVAFVFKIPDSSKPTTTIVDSTVVSIPETPLTPITEPSVIPVAPVTAPPTVEQPKTTDSADLDQPKADKKKAERKHKVKKPKAKSTTVIPITAIAPQTTSPTITPTKIKKTKNPKVKEPKIIKEKAPKIKEPKEKASKVSKTKAIVAPVIVASPKTTTEKIKHQHGKPVKVDTYFFQQKTFNVELKTNLLALVATAPNLEAEFIFVNRVSLNIEGQWAHTDWKNDTRHFRLWNFSPEIRVYPFKKTAVFFGAYYNIGEYNFKFNQTGYQGKYQGAGLSVGYKLPVTRSVGFEFSLGAGFLTTRVSNYYTEDGCNRFISSYSNSYIAPTKAKISFIWRIGGAK